MDWEEEIYEEYLYDRDEPWWEDEKPYRDYSPYKRNEFDWEEPEWMQSGKDYYSIVTRKRQYKDSESDTDAEDDLESDNKSSESVEENIQDKATQKKKTTTKKSSSICPWFCGIFLLSAAIAGVIAYDYHSHGAVFEKSATGKALKNAGLLPYVETAWYKTMSTSARGYKWAEENIPVYYAKASVVAKPYVNLSCDLFKIVRNSICQTCETIRDYFKDKSPAVAEFIEGYAPGLPQKIQDFSSSAWSTSVNAYQNSCEFFKTKVFVGSLSPESLGKAINQTQIVAAQYYSWFHEKVDAYAKIK